MNQWDALDYLKDSRRQTIHSVASSAWLVYDLLTTFDQEVTYVWRSANSLPKYLYFVSRYVGIAGQLALASGQLPIFCTGELLTSLVLLSSMLLSIELSLMLRIDALYGRSRQVRLLLGIAFFIEVASAAAINGLLYPRTFRELRPFPPDWPVKGCFYPTNVFLNKLCWIPILSFETLLFCLNTAKCISYGPLDDTPLIYRLFRDGSAYFVIVFGEYARLIVRSASTSSGLLAIMIICTVAQFTDNGGLSTVAAVWISAVLSYSGCHLLLSIRRIAARRRHLDLTLVSVRVPDVYDEDKSPISTDDPYPSPSSTTSPRVSLARPGESIELVPRRLLHAPRDDEERTGSSESCSSKRRRSESQSDSVSTAWLEQWKP
ncbi:hypothetical protein ONZ51_g96 [Trametes cubensis]|uniref:DUF6533 domain-containing protein n=1 Tax=Trametes cubensis TaxID=1111947 RepID=A0AAD7XEB2_9APHY|nr:hypothetical protein ONZ51_g96 [Trametes cubensis]